MRRRDFISLVGSTVIAWPLAARAQQPGRIYRVAHLTLNGRDAPQYVALYAALKSEGFVDGQNLMVDTRNFDLRIDQLGDRAAAAVKGRSAANSGLLWNLHLRLHRGVARSSVSARSTSRMGVSASSAPMVART
jgi:hypothetical protein